MAQDNEKRYWPNEKRYSAYAQARSEVITRLVGESDWQAAVRLREVYRILWLDEEPASRQAIARTFRTHLALSETAPVKDRQYHASMAKKVRLVFPEMILD